jgi:alpha-beta hydrolase superfamily lysophospholipase
MRALVATRNDECPYQACRWMLLIIFLLGLAVAADVSAQERSAEKDDGPPKPRELKLKTKDDVGIRAAYFPSEEGKDAITVLIVHEWKGQARPYFNLCYALQDAGFAVVIPDYRGHGGSREYVDRRGESKRFNLARMSKRDLQNIIRYDLETVKKFLKEENNEGRLNLNALVVIGIGEGNVLGGHWAQQDWKFPSVGRKKQGQDVKALVLISPVKQAKGIPLEPVLKDKNLILLPMMVVAGKGSSEATEARTIAKRLEGVKKKMGRGTPRGFELQMPNTKLSGARLVNEVSDVVKSIIEFIRNEVKISEEDNPWIDRL